MQHSASSADVGSVVDMQTMCAVVEIVRHAEPATAIEPAEASLLVQEQQASWLLYNADAISDTMLEGIVSGNNRSATSVVDDSAHDASSIDHGLANHGRLEEVETRPWDFGDAIHIVSFSRSGELLMQSLHKGRGLEPLRQAAAQRGQECRLESGASIFVYPDHYEAVCLLLKKYRLQPHHAVVAEAFLPLLYDEIGELPCRAKVKVRSSSWMAMLSHDCKTIVTVEHTFMWARSARMQEEAATASTSQWRGFMNHRTLQPDEC